MRITCPHCGSKSIITSSRVVDNKTKDLYISCLNFECTSKGLMTLKYQYDITPPQKNITKAIEEIIANMSPGERCKIINKFQKNN